MQRQNRALQEKRRPPQRQPRPRPWHSAVPLMQWNWTDCAEWKLNSNCANAIFFTAIPKAIASTRLTSRPTTKRWLKRPRRRTRWPRLSDFAVIANKVEGCRGNYLEGFSMGSLANAWDDLV